MANLQKYLEMLLPDKSIFAVDPGFLRKEPSGVVAISERGHGTGLPATRLYVYPDDSTKIIHVILIGNKNTQSVDIQLAIAFVEDLKKKTSHEHDQGKKENEA